MRGGAGHSRLLFRSYLFIVLALIAVATVLDVGFSYLQSSADEEEPWSRATIRLLESRLAGIPADERQRLAAQIARNIGVGVQLLDAEDIAGSDGTGDAVALIDDAGREFKLWHSSVLDASIRLGPLPRPDDKPWLGLLTPLFYLSIFVIVGLWLRPLLRDLGVLTSGAQRFAADYREPLTTASETSELTELAGHLDAMSERLSALIQGQKELTAALSHEMRTPLARLRFAIAVARDNQDEELVRQLEEMGADVQEIDTLTATMLDYARLDNPDRQMNWQETPVAPWLEQTLDKCRDARKDIAVVASDVPDSMQMDPRLMALALSNLVVNACRYGKGRVRVGARCDEHSNYVFVEDDGEGIDESDRHSVFKAFTRLDSSRSRETGGFGLGLAIVARIAEHHGGRVQAGESSELGGAKITLHWPRRRDGF